MKGVIIPSLIFLFLITNAKTAVSQDRFRSIALDAIELRKHAVIEEDISILINNGIISIDLHNLLSYYSSSDNYYQIINEFDKNPFLNIELETYEELGTDPPAPPPEKFTSPEIIRSGLLASAGSMDVTNLAYGLTDFLIDRAKTELNIAFFRRFKNEIIGSPDLKLLFPQTYTLLDLIDKEIYNYNLFLQSMRNAFESDLRRLPNQIGNWLNENKNDIDTDILNTLTISLRTSVLLTDNRHPGKVLNELANELNRISFKEEEFKNLNTSIQISFILSEAFRATSSSNNYWVSTNEIREVSDPVTLRLFLGLLYQDIKINKAKNIFITENLQLLNALKIIGNNWTSHHKEITDLITSISSQLITIENRVETLIETGNRVQKENDLSSIERKRLMLNAYFDVSASLLDFLNDTPVLLMEISELKDILNSEQITKIRGLFSKIESSQQIAVYVTNRQYTNAISQAYYLLEDLKDTEESKEWQKFLKYGTFMTNLVEADSPEAVAIAIEASAAPPGSYSIKRHSSFSVALNGYLGGFGGIEIINVTGKYEGAFNPSITAPVGVSLNWRRNSILPTGLFLSVIDLGTIASYRFSNESTSTQPEIRLKNILAPGFSFEWGWENAPLTFALGYQLGPQLRSIEANDTTLGDIYHRIGASVKVDIPILYFNISQN